MRNIHTYIHKIQVLKEVRGGEEVTGKKTKFSAFLNSLYIVERLVARVRKPFRLQIA